MDAYSGFAQVYDEFMDNVPYAEWCDYLCKILHEHGVDDGLVLDLGCGTGTLTELLASAGYDMIGVDGAEDMLSIAMDKRAQSGHDILYLLQDMREFELYGTVRAIISVCDCMNYLTEPADFAKVLRLVANYLDYGGLFLFDLNTPYKYEKLLADRTFAENREDCSFIWENDYDPKRRINEYALTFFVRTDEDGEFFERYTETHYQRAYEQEEVIRMIKEAGLEPLACYDAMTFAERKPESERIQFVARRPFPER